MRASKDYVDREKLLKNVRAYSDQNDRMPYFSEFISIVFGTEGITIYENEGIPYEVGEEE